jgi:hypothetical protein
MPIRRYAAKDAAFDAATIEIMSKAFNAALESLRQSRIQYPDQLAEWVRETLALRIIETAQNGGERDLDRLRDDALGHLALAKPPPPSL